MKKILQITILMTFFFCSLESKAAEATFDPNIQYYDMNGNGILSLWGIPAANGAAVKANPDYGYPTEASIASWLAMIMKAQELQMSVVVGYDPVTFDIWYVAKPR